MPENIQSATNAAFTGAVQGNAKSATKSLGKDEFMKLLTFQLKSQNPMKPMENQEFASQLAQFSQLEKVSEMAMLLEKQIQSNSMLTQAVTNMTLPGIIGKSVKAYSEQFNFDGEKPPKIGFELPYKASSVTVEIKDAAGNLVRMLNLKDAKSGDNKIEWDGKARDGKALPAGNYRVEIKALDAGGKPMPGFAFLNGTISTVRYKPEGAVVLVNGVEIPVSNITDVTQ